MGWARIARSREPPPIVPSCEPTADIEMASRWPRCVGASCKMNHETVDSSWFCEAEQPRTIRQASLGCADELHGTSYTQLFSANVLKAY